MQIVDFKEKQTEEEQERIKIMCDQLDELKEIVKDGRMTQILLCYDEELEEVDQDSGGTSARHLVFWNETDDMDALVGFAERITWRMTAIAETSSE